MSSLPALLHEQAADADAAHEEQDDQIDHAHSLLTANMPSSF
jgi:hypothetical protein